MASSVDWSAQASPGSTMFGLSSMPSSSTRCERNAVKTASKVSSVTASQRASVWAPSIKTSGSTIGTMPASWQSAA